MRGYGQIYRTSTPSGYPKGDKAFPYAMAWRGTIYDADLHNKPVWEGLACGHPDEAFDQMKKIGEKFECADLRRWSGVLPEPKFKDD